MIVGNFIMLAIMAVLFGILAFDLDDIYNNLNQQEQRIAWVERYCEPGN
jgi:hypothetical protein